MSSRIFLGIQCATAKNSINLPQILTVCIMVFNKLKLSSSELKGFPKGASTQEGFITVIQAVSGVPVFWSTSQVTFSLLSIYVPPFPFHFANSYSPLFKNLSPVISQYLESPSTLKPTVFPYPLLSLAFQHICSFSILAWIWFACY